MQSNQLNSYLISVMNNPITEALSPFSWITWANEWTVLAIRNDTNGTTTIASGSNWDKNEFAEARNWITVGRIEVSIVVWFVVDFRLLD